MERRHFELIDTLWNVNLKFNSLTDFLTRINRYIMECKYEWVVVEAVGGCELIDTLWNVNRFEIGGR